MRKIEDRYLVYMWDQSDINSYENDYTGDFFENLEAGYRNIAEYGTFIDSTNDEQEANDLASKTADDNYRCEVSIYDQIEKCWFN